MDIQYESTNKWASYWYHKWTIQDLHQKWKEIRTRWKQNTKLSTSKQDPPHLKHSNNVYMPLTIDSPDIKGDKNNTSKTTTLWTKFFDELRGNWITIVDAPTKEDIEKFWKPLYENKNEYTKDAKWLQEYKTYDNNITGVTYSEIATNEIKSEASEFSNWKSPGLDKLHNFWWNKLTTLHPKVAVAFDKLIVQPENCPDWLTTGQTTLIAKKEPTRNPSNYRPITCLPVMH